MSIGPSGESGGEPSETVAFPPGIAAADWRAHSRLRVAIDDLFLPEDARLDDRLRAALSASLAEACRAIEGAVRQHAARLLMARDAGALARRLATTDGGVMERLAGAGVLRDAELMGELFGRVRHELIAARLPAQAPDEPDRPSLLPQLAGQADHVVASAAIALMAAEGRRRGASGEYRVGNDLPAELHHRLVWWVAAALRERFAGAAGEQLEALDRSLAEAALRSIAAHDEADGMEATAARLAAAIDPRADELPVLLTAALADRRLALFVALIARALRIDHGEARELVLDPVADRLWLVLRALDVDRTSIARIGLALSDADPARDVERFADDLDAIASVGVVEARRQLAPLLLHRDYRAAMLALAGSVRR